MVLEVLTENRWHISKIKKKGPRKAGNDKIDPFDPVRSNFNIIITTRWTP